MKKVFYILNLLFLTLLTFGGSVFAANTPPTQYIDTDGSVNPIPTGTPVNHLTNTPISGGWYYLDSSDTSVLKVVIGESTANNPVNIVVNGTVNLASGSWINVQENTVVNFYCGTSGADVTYDPANAPTLSISNTQLFTIGSCTGGSYGKGFGTINFNSGNYIVTNTTGVPIGSPDQSGGSITVNSAASVQAYNDLSNSPPVAAVGVNAASQKCEIQVNGGLLQATKTYLTTTTSRIINAGKNGTVTVSDQGEILSSVNPNEPGDNGTWIINSGIAGYTLGTYPTDKNQWAAVVGGTVTLPVAEGILQQDLTPPVNAQNGCWNLLTVNPGAVLNLGTTDPGGTATLLVGYSYGTPVTPSSIENYGTVNVIDLNQNTTFPSAWNNNPGSVLTIASGAELALYQGTFTNYAAAQGKSDGQVTLSGTLTLADSGIVENNGNMIIDSPVSKINGGSGLVNGEDGTVELTGTLTLTGTAADFNTFGTLDIGPIGTVDGQLNNQPGGTVMSQNPCYLKTR